MGYEEGKGRCHKLCYEDNDNHLQESKWRRRDTAEVGVNVEEREKEYAFRLLVLVAQIAASEDDIRTLKHSYTVGLCSLPVSVSKSDLSV